VPTCRMVLSDITDRKRVDEIQLFMAQTSSSKGESFFDMLARYLAQTLDMDSVCINRLEGAGLTARTVSVWCDGHFEDNFTYALKDTPCGDVVGKMVCCFPASVSQFFPRDQALQDLRAESYVGVTLFGHTGQPVGLIAVIGRKPLTNRSLAENTLKLVAVRTAGEMERLEAEEALKESEERHRSSIQAVTNPFAVINADTYIIEMANDAFGGEEVVGKPCYCISHSRETPCGGGEHPCPLELIRQTGKTVTIEHVYDYIFDTAPVLFFKLGAEGSVLSMNHYARQVCGELSPGMKFQDFILDFNSIFDLKNLSDTQSGEQMFNINTLSGYPQSYSFLFKPVGKEILAFGHLDIKDIDMMRTEFLALNQELGNLSRQLHKKNAELQYALDKRKKTEEALQQAVKVANAASQAKGEFLANMSHEIRTPLNGVIGFTDLLKGTPLNPQQQKYVDNANTSAHALMGIINDILDFSKIDADRLELEIIKTDMLELLEQTADIVKHEVARKKLTFLFTIAPDLPCFAMVDPVRLKQVLLNLLSNAVKFTLEGEVELKVDFEEKGPSSGKFTFLIRDTGTGIPTEQQGKLFKAFSQADSSTTRKFGGTGLGLVISARLVEKMGGQIALSSDPGRGSVFVFSLETEFERGEKPFKESITQIKQVLNSSIILVAEDVELNMDLILLVIRQLMPGAEILEAKNGKAAVEMVKQNKPDLVLMDVQMPEMDGFEATAHIREHEAALGRHTPIIALTAGALESEKERCLQSGMDDFLSKPIDRKELCRVFSKYLNLAESS